MAMVEGIPVHRLKVSYPPRWQAYLSLYNPAVAHQLGPLLDQVRPDVVHAHNVHAYLTYHSLTLAKRRGLSVVLTAHDAMMVTYQKLDSFIDPSWRHVPDSFDYRVSIWYQLRKQRFRYFPLRNAIIRRVLWQAVDALVSPSQALLDVLSANRMAARRMVCIPNGVDAAAFETSDGQRAEFQTRYDLVGRRIIVLAGRVSQAKGGLQMLKAMQLIVREVPNATLLVLAPPEGSSKGLLAVAESLGIRQYIRFAGWLTDDELAAAFGAADVCVTPSVVFDTFPTVNLEAMAAGTPVVATCFGGSRELVVDGETGFIVNPFNVDMLAERVTRLLADAELRHEMGERARERIRQHYDWLVQAERLLKLYQQIRDANER